MLFDFLKKKKKIYPESAKYKKGELVNFRYRGELSIGVIYDAEESEENGVIYTLQKGGECPVIVYNISEKSVVMKIK